MSETARQALLFFMIAFALTLSLSGGRDLDIDEHGFIASGALMARNGLLPYRDYHYNHMPTEVMIYAALFRMSDHLLLVARVFQAFCAACIATAIFATASRAMTRVDRGGRLRFGWAMGLLLLTNQVFTRTAGLSWNHDFPLLMALLSFLSLRWGLSGRHRLALMALAGSLLGVAATSRLTFLPLLAPFGLFVILYPGMKPRTGLVLVTVFAAGFAVASLPSLWVWSKAWENAFFGNFLYPRLNTTIHQVRDKHTRVTVVPILLYYLMRCVTLPTLGVLALSFVYLMARQLHTHQWREPRSWELLILVAIVVVLTMTAFMPRPPYPQYIYATLPFMLLAIALALRHKPLEGIGGRLLPGAWIFCILFGGSLYWRVVLLPTPRLWLPMKVHAIGRELVRQLPPGTVLTIEPLFPLEGGAQIDPRFAVGRFAPRVADLLTPAQRHRYLMPGLVEMSSVFDEDAPGSVLIVEGSDDRVQESMISEASRRGYKHVVLSVGWGTNRRFGEAWVRDEDSP